MLISMKPEILDRSRFGDLFHNNDVRSIYDNKA